jgi:hypothetical protein
MRGNPVTLVPNGGIELLYGTAIAQPAAGSGGAVTGSFRESRPVGGDDPEDQAEHAGQTGPHHVRRGEFLHE